MSLGKFNIEIAVFSQKQIDSKNNVKRCGLRAYFVLFGKIENKCIKLQNKNHDIIKLLHKYCI